ncbi:cobalamin (vitamin B12) biosynthesis CbiM protein [Limosilactobacillus equigenerosi DSM 18793 = JCM 14505]|uniref:Cobalamin (Vitamin B12) biosynthesis CbiM protein n=2 Tax=Limosilactobacillus TaxID=2742598 RepID=A0A0R1UI40_9LACO|nr:cobalamin (vitamin B12) biosynthesis CbiM protein [Limosilactobacillus equigenerosi DSM 18793 = JCM 14505]
MLLISTPIIGYAGHQVKVQLNQQRGLAPMLGIGASLSFLMMMFNVPIPGGTTAHAVGATLLAILMGPYAASISVTVALIVQAFLFGDGGILALGANIFDMAIVMPFVGYAVYAIFRKFHHPNLGTIVGSYIGINVAALMAGILLGIQPLVAHTANGAPLYCPYGLKVTIPAMLFAHLLVAGWIEAFFTFMVYRFVKRVAPNEIYQTKLNIVDKSEDSYRKLYWVLAILIILCPIGLIANGTAFGEWSNGELLALMKHDHLANSLPHGMVHGINYQAIFSDYTVPGTSLPIGYILSAISAIIIFVILAKIISSSSGRNHG